MSGRSEYGEWPATEHLYLEDSYVLEILERPGELVFRMEFVLRPKHEMYHRPSENAQYCYLTGELIFCGATEIQWLERSSVQSFDATGEHDLGNIDSLYQETGRFVVSGDWGRVTLAANEVAVELDDERRVSK